MIQPDQSNYRYIKPVAAPEGGVRLVLPGGRALRMTSQQKRVRVPLKEPNAGRSPRTRGKRQPNELLLKLTGTIPAHAGETTAQHAWSIVPGDDPRARGGNKTHSRTLRLSSGRSPRTRGKLWR